MIRVADYVIERLVQAGIDKIFLITGRGILYLSDAVAKNPDMEGISTYHEQGASYAAMAYAKQKDSMGACLVSTGCAATNAVTAALCAWQDNVPCIFVSGQHMLNETTRYTGLPIRTYGSQEADILDIVQPITKYAVMLTDGANVAYEMDKALFLANEGRKGPVWIDIPLDVQNMRVEPGELSRFVPLMEQIENGKKELDITNVICDLQNASRPVIFVGGGVRTAGASDLLKKFVEKNEFPVVFSTSATDTYGSGNFYSIGAVGSLGGSRAGNFVVQNADYILVLGSKLCSQTIGAEAEKFAREAKITVVDIDPNEHKKKGALLNQIIIRDIKIFLAELLEQELHINCKDWLKKCLHWKETFSIGNEEFIRKNVENNIIDLYDFADKISEQLKDDTTVITDAGFEELIVPSAIKYREEQRCLFPAAQGAMGYAIPAIIGAYYAGAKDIISIVGDGSIMMNVQELLTIQWKNIPAKIFVINNNMYAVIRKRQKDLFRNRTIGNDPTDGVGAPDFERLAYGFNIPYIKIDNVHTLTEDIERVLEMKGPCICEVMCTEEQKYFHSSYAFNESRKLVKRPIEDMSPFISRELFRTEMLIESLE